MSGWIRKRSGGEALDKYSQAHKLTHTEAVELKQQNRNNIADRQFAGGAEYKHKKKTTANQPTVAANRRRIWSEPL